MNEILLVAREDKANDIKAALLVGGVHFRERLIPNCHQFYVSDACVMHFGDSVMTTAFGRRDTVKIDASALVYVSFNPVV